MASMEEKIQIKRQRTETFIASLPGQSKKVRVVTFTQAQLPKAHVTETGGLLGMVLFNDGQATFQQDNTSFVRALLMNSNYPNIYNYSSVNQYPLHRPPTTLHPTFGHARCRRRSSPATALCGYQSRPVRWRLCSLAQRRRLR